MGILSPMPMNHQFVLGVDGGGTKTEACLASGNAEIIGRGFAGSSNVKAVGTERAQANLRHAIQQAWSDAGLTPQVVSCAVFALSGAGQPETQSAIKEWAVNNGICQQALVVHDALPVLAAGAEDGVGVALIAGTGAVALACNKQSETTVVGGWGYWFGDEGSAFWLGQSATRAAAHASDGRSGPTLLTDAILNRLGISQPREILSALSREDDVRTALAGLADLVAHCAEQGDAAARGIINEGASHLASLVTTAAEKAGLGTAFPLSVAGGVLTGSAQVREALSSELAVRMIKPTSVEIVTNPVLGCIRLALQNPGMAFPG